MSTARIVSLIVGAVAFVAGVALFYVGNEVNTIDYVGGQFVIDSVAAQRADMLHGLGIAGLIAGVMGIAIFIALTVRDQRQID